MTSKRESGGHWSRALGIIYLSMQIRRAVAVAAAAFVLREAGDSPSSLLRGNFICSKLELRTTQINLSGRGWFAGILLSGHSGNSGKGIRWSVVAILKLMGIIYPCILEAAKRRTTIYSGKIVWVESHRNINFALTEIKNN